MGGFEAGDIVVFEPANFNTDFWKSLSESEKLEYYGRFGYKNPKIKLFVFLCYIKHPDGDKTDHCILISLDDQKLETCVHASDFRKADEEEV